MLVPEVLEASDGVLDAAPGVPLEPPDTPDVPAVPVVDGRLSSTSPADVPVVGVLRAALPVAGTQFVPLALAPVVDVVADPLALDPLIEPVVPAAPVVVLAAAPDAPEVPAALVASLADPLVAGVVPVPFAPFVVFSPVKRWSGLVAVLAVSLVTPAAPPPIVVEEV